MEAPEVSRVPVGTAVDYTLCFIPPPPFFKLYSLIVTLHHALRHHRPAVISVADTWHPY